MKRHITKSQWKELCKGGDKLWITHSDFLSTEEELSLSFADMSIGGMIEFLGDNLKSIGRSKGWTIYISLIADGNFIEGVANKKELVDSLWEAVKYRIQNWKKPINP